MKQLIKPAKIAACVLALSVACFLEACKSSDTTPVPQIVASFTNTVEAATGKVTFTNTSKNGTSYLWDFGDASATSALENPVHTYAKTGNYSVKLTVSGVAGTTPASVTNAVNVTVTVVPVIVASFTSLENGTTGSVTFTNTSQNGTSYVWDFGDASATSTLQNPVHTYTATGNYSVKLTVSGVAGTTPVSVTNVVNVTVKATGTFDGGLVINGDFEAATSTPWIVGLSTPPVPAPVVTANGNKYYSQAVATAGNVYDVNLSQRGITIVKGSTYKLTFDAWSDVSRSIVAGIGLSGGNYDNTSQPVNLTTTKNTFNLTLTAATWGDDPDSRVLFDIGGATGTVNIDNVSLVKVASPTLPALPVDFEGNNVIFTTFDDGVITATLAANPSKTGINTSNNVLQVTKPMTAHAYDGIQATFGSNFDLTKSFSMQVYSSKANVKFRFEVQTDPANPASGNPPAVLFTIPTANTWTTVTFQFTGVPANNVGTNQLVIKPDNDLVDSPLTSDGTYYIDNISQP